MREELEYTTSKRSPVASKHSDFISTIAGKKLITCPEMAQKIPIVPSIYAISIRLDMF